MNEIQSAFGLLQLNYIDEAIARRQKIDRCYREQLANTQGIVIPDSNANLKSNYSYFPILVRPDYKMSRDALYDHLKKHNILTRRYFYPLLSNLNMYKNMSGANKETLPVANQIAEQVLCLPIYPDMTPEELSTIIELITA